MMYRARQLGYQVVFVLFRATGDMPVQSDKLYHMLSWRDIKEPSDYIYSKYVKPVAGRRMYLYGVSLGGAIQTHYILNDNADTPFSAMVSYGNPFAPEDTIQSFKDKMWGLYDVGLGLHLNGKLKASLPDLAKYTSKEKMDIYRNGLYNESYRLTSIDSHIIAPMFGFKDSMAYYKASRISGSLHKIKRCPTMFLESWDDILMDRCYPVEEIRNNPNVLLACTDRGGHCCHLTHSKRKLTGLPFIDCFSWFFPSSNWFADPCMDFIETVEKQHRM